MDVVYAARLHSDKLLALSSVRLQLRELCKPAFLFDYNLNMMSSSMLLFQRRKSQKFGFWSGSSAVLGNELSRNGRANTYDTAVDPLLSQFISNIAYADPLTFQQEELSSNNVAVASDVKRLSTFLFDIVAHVPKEPRKSFDVADEYTERSSHCDIDNEERRKRAASVQQLIESTIF
ncbi:hypothetical protein FNV43_RR21457 [Rhamnella rubrinervis]|uniref:Uncharacterized protein n=1 Tax=Rhamnella rubrinervis TaxID=2594499 RepID=A0A8K0E2B3_9ROSA|nr:hypothetical protein FNV43_RR21457 [Rhamnella rubrinervis]